MVDPIIVKIDRELESLVPRFLDNRRRDIRLIESALAKNDLDSVRKMGHSLKGVGGGYGFAEITRYGAAIEVAAQAGDGLAAAAAASALDAYLDALQVEYV
jgi:HPt (histidine-containing phosphotransfer) domain-containing protein